MELIPPKLITDVKEIRLLHFYLCIENANNIFLSRAFKEEGLEVHFKDYRSNRDLYWHQLRSVYSIELAGEVDDFENHKVM